MSTALVPVAPLFQSAADAGAISSEALQALNIRDIGTEIQAGLGISVDDVGSAEAILVSLLIDDSSSIRFTSGNSQLVRDGHNLVIEALTKSKQKDGILAMCRYLNKQTLYGYRLIEQAPPLTNQNYNPDGNTPLYDQTLITLGTVVAKCQQFQDAGVPCRSVTGIFTDGADSGSRSSASEVKKLVADMLRMENHIVAGIGVDDGETDFRKVFREMGIPDEWILTPKNSPSDIRRAFNMLSQSALRASQLGATFNQTAMGGFASP